MVTFSAALASLAMVSVAIPAAAEADAERAAVAIADDPRYDTDVDDLVYGQPDDVLENYTAYLEKLELIDPEHWGGGFVDGDTLVIRYVNQSHASASSAIARIGVQRSIRLEESRISIATFDAAVSAVSALDDLTGVPSAVGPDYVNERLIVEFLSPDAYAVAAPSSDQATDASAPAEIQAPTSTDLDMIESAIDIPFAATVTEVVPVSTSRYYDTTPFKGGAAIKMRYSSSASSLCSTGFGWEPPSGTSGQYILTASHCAMAGDGLAKSVVHRYLSDGTTSKIGDVVYRSGDGNGTVSGRKGDVAVIRLSTGTSSARVYHGTYNTTTTRVSGTAVAVPAGWQDSSYTAMYTSGASGKGGKGPGQISPDRVTKTNYTMTYLDDSGNPALAQTFSNLTVAEHASQCVADGDSGGAVYLLDPSGLRPAGIISGNNIGGIGPTNCWSFYSPLSNISSEWGGSVKTG